jgi:DNA-nicking Smr family endonuclease
MADKKIPNSDLKDWENFLENGDVGFVDKDIPNKKEVLEIDLHGLVLDDAFEVLTKVFEVKAKGFVRFEIITGMGKKDGDNKGALYKQVPSWLRETELQKYIKNFRRSEKNEGVIIVRLL